MKLVELNPIIFKAFAIQIEGKNDLDYLIDTLNVAIESETEDNDPEDQRLLNWIINLKKGIKVLQRKN
jgi:hypothetical protein